MIFGCDLNALGAWAEVWSGDYVHSWKAKNERSKKGMLLALQACLSIYLLLNIRDRQKKFLH